MKLKYLMPIIISIIIGILFGKIIFNQYKKNIDTVFNEETSIYILQQGSYKNEDAMYEGARKVSNFLYVKEDNLYKVYVCITKEKEIALKVKGIFEVLGNDIYIKETSNIDDKFIKSLNIYNQNIEATDKKEEILDTCRDVLKIYEEMIKRTL